jgi:hypothetical protein
MFIGSSFSQANKTPDCKVLKHCTLKYTNDTISRYEVVFNGNRQIQIDSYYGVTKSKVKWINECEFQLTVLETDLLEGIEIGNVYRYKIESVIGNKVEGALVYEGYDFPVHYQIMDKK